jgi:hypothetical protein
VVNALAKAGIELGENGSIFPRPKGKARKFLTSNQGLKVGTGIGTEQHGTGGYDAAFEPVVS